MATPHSTISDEPRFVTDSADLFWEQNKNLILGAVALVVIALIGAGFWWQQRAVTQAEATALAATGNTPEVWQKVVDQYPTTPAAALCYIHLASKAQQGPDYSKALGYYDAFLKNFPKHPAAQAVRFTRAQLLEASGQTEPAKAAYLAILNADETFAAPAGISLARVYQAEGNLAKARETLQSVLLAKNANASTAEAKAALDRLQSTFPQAQ
jgi:tetratricopeptide (TPR) repeat protein